MKRSIEEYEELLKKDREFVIHSKHTPKETKDVIIFSKAKGATMTDVKGDEYIDTIAAGFNMHLGHNRQELIDEATKQLSLLETHLILPSFSNKPTVALAEKLINITNKAFPNIASAYFTNGGAEANEAAIHLALLYWENKGLKEKKKIISLKQCYHGSTFLTVSLNPDVENWGWKRIASDKGSTFLSVPFAHESVITKDLLKSGENVGKAAARIFEDLIKEQDPNTIAAFIFEPIQGDGGIIIPHDDYFPLVRDLCKKNNILLIADEVMTFGKTGTWYAMERWNVTPDLITIAKGLSGGYLPVGACLVSKDIKETAFSKTQSWQHDYTYSGHAVGLAVSLRTLEIMEKENTNQLAIDKGESFRKILRDTLKGNPLVKEIRGLGIMTGLQFDEAIGKEVEHKMLHEQHILVHPNRKKDTLNFAPPLNITEDQMNRIATSLAKVLDSFAGRR